jgi:hypothetical protein
VSTSDLTPTETLAAAADWLDRPEYDVICGPNGGLAVDITGPLVALLRSEAQVYAAYEATRAAAERRGLAVLVAGLSLDEALALARAILGEVDRGE